MAELNAPAPQQKGKGKVRSKKMSTHVDLTAMVDLAFLLITFFMLTTTLSKPQSMNLGMPDKSDPTADQTKVSQTRTMTLLLGENNKLIWYMGLFDTPTVDTDTGEAFNVTSYGKDGIRKELLAKNSKLLAQAPQRVQSDTSKVKENGLIVIIKPSDKTKYYNVVDALDEMVISGIKQYAIVDITPIEVKLLQDKQLYPKN